MDYGHDLQFGAFLTPVAAQPEQVVRGAELAEELGLDLVSFQDHPYQSRFLDTWTLLSYLAARTNRVTLAPNVVNLPLRPPSVLARAAASLDLLSDGRVELGLGAGAFWEAIEAMGGRRLSPGEAVDALAEAIAVMRALWDSERRGGARLDGEHHALRGASRGPAPAHPISLWIGAYKPRMLALTGRLGDGWLPSVPYMEPAGLAAGNAAVDAAAREAGRDPHQIRRLLNVSGAYSDGSPGPLEGPSERQAEELARLALEHGVSAFLATGDDPRELRRFATEVVPAVQELVSSARGVGGGDAAPNLPAPQPPVGFAPGADAGDEYARLGVTPTPDDGTRLAEPRWDEATRPHRAPSGPDVVYTEAGRAAGKHLIDVHDHLRHELTELREVVAQVRDGALDAGAARSALHEMALRQNDWTLGAFCSRYCRVVAQHHTIEDQSVFPHLRAAEPQLEPVVDRLAEEHLVIHDAIEEVDRALVHHLGHPHEFDRLQTAIDVLTDTLLSHLSYEERELIEPLARLGFQPTRL